MREIAQKLSRCSSFGALMDDAFARCPEREAIVYEDWRLTYGDLERYIHQTAHYLRHLGVRKGSRVAILSRNCPEWIIAEFALYQLGAIVVKINWRLTPPEQARMLARNQVSVAFLKAEKPEWGAELERLCADSVRLIRLEPVDGRSALCALVSGEPDTPPDVPVSRDDVACRLHTSGTTGEPKCARRHAPRDREHAAGLSLPGRAAVSVHCAAVPLGCHRCAPVACDRRHDGAQGSFRT